MSAFAANHLILPAGKAVATITLTEPWASAIRLGIKRWETRSWPVKYRGPIAIHAAKTFPPDARAFAHSRAGQIPVLPVLRLNLGCVLAVADLVECRAADSLSSVLSPARLAVEDDWGDLSPGRWAFKLENIRPLSAPTWASGQLGIWKWYPEQDIHLLPPIDFGADQDRPPSAPIGGK